MGDSAMEEGRWKPFKLGVKVTGGVWEGSLFGDSSIRTEGEDGVGVDWGRERERDKYSSFVQNFGNVTSSSLAHYTAHVHLWNKK